MKTLEELRRRIDNVNDMKSVVSTMKTMAAASIRQYETAAEATRKFDETIQMSLQILLRNSEQSQNALQRANVQKAKPDSGGIIIFGSDQGLCGRFNEEVVAEVERFLSADSIGRPNMTLTVGTRLNPLLEEIGLSVSDTFHVPASVPDITRILQDMMPVIEMWLREHQVQRIDVFYSRRTSTATYTPTHYPLLPLDERFLNELKSRPWPSRCLPIHVQQWQTLFSGVLQQYLFLQLFRACAESRASENASRIASMQQAEKNITERLGELQAGFNQQRQNAITEELMDILSGFEVAGER